MFVPLLSCLYTCLQLPYAHACNWRVYCCRLLGVPCTYPPSGGDWVKVNTPPLRVPVQVHLPRRAGDGISQSQLQSTNAEADAGRKERQTTINLPHPSVRRPMCGAVVGRAEDGSAVDLRVLSRSSAESAALPMFRLRWQRPP
jgi:hypothetical protein